MRFRFTLVLLAGFLKLDSAIADCPDYYFLSLKITSKSKCEAQHLMTVGSGIVSPSSTGIFNENPAGLAYNYAPKILLTASKLDSSTLNPWRLNATFVTGNGTVGGGIGTFAYEYGNSYISSSNVIAYGGGLEISPLKITIGSSVFSYLTNPVSLYGYTYGAPISTSVWTFGAIWNAKGVVRLAGTVFDAYNETTRSIGLGVGTYLGQTISLAIDATRSPTNEGFSNMLKAGMGLAFESFQMSVTYGQYLANSSAVSSSVENFARKGLSLGAAAEFTKHFKGIVYINRLELYYFGALIGFN